MGEAMLGAIPPLRAATGHRPGMNRWWSIGLALGVAGCTSHSAAAPDAAPHVMVDAPFVTAGHPTPPQAVSGGGPVQTAPTIIPVFFAGDSAMQGQIEPYLATLAASDYWPTATSEYGVGAMTVMPTIVSSDTPPTSDNDLQAWLSANTDGTHPGWPTSPGINTTFAVYLPAGVTLGTPFGTSCMAFGGYHDETSDATGGPLVYALMPRCSDSLDGLSSVTSHELVEASTDPLPFSMGAWQDTDNADAVWMMVPGGELGDMCEYVHAAEQRIVGNYVVQRTWSNRSAAAGHDPCVPVMSTPYLTATPLLTDNLMIDLGPPQGMVATNGIQVAMGMSKTIEVDLWSDGPVADWTVKAIDVASGLAGGPPELTLTLDQATGNNGDKLHLTITRVKQGTVGGGSEFVLSSRVDNASVSLWWGYVGN